MSEMPGGQVVSTAEAAGAPAVRAAVEALSDAAADVIGAAGPSAILSRICRLAVQFVGAQGACVHLFALPSERTVRSVSARAGQVPVSDAAEDQHVRSVRSRLAGQVKAASHGAGEHVVAPLTTAGGRVLGGLCLWSPASPAVPAGDVLFAELLRLAGVALEKATQLEHEQWLVLELQRSLLPEVVPAVPGAEVCARYRPASSGVDVGGDWYDIFPLAAGKFAFVLGDVAGHGVHAASVMGQVRMALRAYALETEDPAEVVSRLNGLMAHLHTSEFTTLILCIWDPPTRQARVVRAGHLPLLKITAEGASIVETTGSLPVGVDALTTYTADRLVLEPGSALLLFSDGLVERRGESLTVGLQRLVEAADEHIGDLDGLCDGLLAALTGPETEDDVALLGVSLEATPAGRIVFDLPARTEQLDEVRERFAEWLREHGANDGDVEELDAMLREAWLDTVQRSAMAGQATLRVEAAIVGRVVDVLVEDVKAREGAAAQAQEAGLSLVQRLSDSFEVRRRRRGTAIVIRRRICEDDGLAGNGKN